MSLSFLSVLLLSFLLGLRHSTDADHVVTISVIVGKTGDVLKSAWIGLFWAMGHTLSLGCAMLAVCLLKISITEQFTFVMELAVAFLLVLLGWNAVRRRGEKPQDVHQAGHFPHLELTAGLFRVGLRPMLIGMVHGLAGSAALAVIFLDGIRQLSEVMLYIVMFGAGTALGMILCTLFMSVPIMFTLRWEKVHLCVQKLLGLGSLCVGVAIFARLFKF